MFCRGLLGFVYGNFGGGGMFILMGFGLLIFLVLIIFVFKNTKANPTSNFSFSNSSALTILNERFAKGEMLLNQEN